MKHPTLSLQHHHRLTTPFLHNVTTLSVPRSTHLSRRPIAVRMSLREDGPSVAIVGVTGAVGQEFLSVISERDFPYRSLKLLASKRSAGKTVSYENRDYTVEELTENSFDDVDIALFSAGGSISKKFGPIAVEKGTIVVDNSSAFRMNEGIPLVIPEVNPEAMEGIKLKSGKGALIANPNCSTIICLMAATPLHRRAKVDIFLKLHFMNMLIQAASGAGAAAMEELELQTREVLEGKEPTCNIFKLQDTAREILSGAPGVVIIDDRAANHFPTPLEVSNKDNVAVGRIRQDVSQDGNYGLDIFVCGDQIRKGAALNAVQIAEMLL